MYNTQSGGQIDGFKQHFLRRSVSASAASDDPWSQCRVKKCKDKFRDGQCDRDCLDSECLRDGFDCYRDRGHCK